MLGENIEVLVCSAAHSLILPHKHEKVPIQDLLDYKNEEANIGRFGLFNVTSPNLNTYYPDVKPEDLKPAEDDFIYPVFRLLSEIVVSKFGSPIDFRKQGVLKNSMKLLEGQTVYTEHEDVVGNHIGVVTETFWQEAYTVNGIKVPAGINGVLKVDGKSNPKIARGILMEPPAIHSDSVSVVYRWSKSHDIDDFYEKLGTYDEKGELIRKVVDEILLYTELSLVPHGADPFAKLLNGNTIRNPEFSAKMYSLHGNKLSMSDFKNLPKGDIEIEISQFNNNFNPENPKKDDKMKDFLLKLAGKVGHQVEGEPDGDKLIEFISNKFAENMKNETDYASEIMTLKKSNGDLQASVDQLTQDLATYNEKKNFIEIGEDQLSNVRTEAEKFYKLLKGEKADEAILTLIQGADIKAATSLLKQYEDEFNELVPLSCAKCHSTEITRATSKREDEDENKDDSKPVIRSNFEVFERRRVKTFDTSRIHGS